MENVQVSDVVTAVEGKLLNDQLDNKYIIDIATDSRQKMQNGLFVAIKGENVDGHKYIKGAVDNGAIAALVSTEPDEYLPNVYYIKVEDTIKALQKLATWYRSKFNIPVVAITGSVGKTTTKDMISSVLETKYKVLKTKGNLNSEIGAPTTVLGLNKSHEIAVIEMGMDHTGQIANISSIVSPNVAVITNIGVAHIEYLKTRENILKAKCEVFEHMSDGGVAILNVDDDMLQTVDNNLRKVWFGKNKNADIMVDNVFVDYKEGVVKADLYIHENKFDLIIPGLSEHLVYSAASAVAVGLEYNISIEEILKGIANYTHTKMRMDIYKLEENILVIDDTYNANPDSMKSLIDTVKKAGVKNKILILGDMFELGEDSLKLHKQVLEYAIKCGITSIIVTGETMKKASENINHEKIHSYLDKEEIISKLDEIIVSDSIIAIKASRGMKLENITEKILEKYTVL